MRPDVTPLFDPDDLKQRELAIAQAVHAVATERRPVDLFAFPTVEPPPAELRVIRQAHARAIAFGLVLPPYPKTTLAFVHPAEDPGLAAQTRRRADGRVEMVFLAGLPLEELSHMALHELRHVHQFATDARLSPAEAEADAEAFAWDAMHGWLV